MEEISSLSILRTLNALYDIPFGATSKSGADLVIERFKATPPGRRLLIMKSLMRDKSVPRFEILGTLNKATGNSERPIISGVASSTRLDLDSDMFSEAALQDMLALKGNLSFLNHDFRLPESALGMITDTSVSKGQVSKLNVTIAVAKENPRALQSWQMIASGVRAGLSVGVIVLESHPIDIPGSKQKGLSIDRVMPLECSLVGLPSQWTDAWATSASKAIKALHRRRS